MSKNLILQEDDCAPDAFEWFLNEFKSVTGFHFLKWKRVAENISADDYHIILNLFDIQAEQSADDPYWKVYRIAEDE